MSILRPSPDEERWQTVGYAARGGGWRRASLPRRCALFALGAVAAVLAFVVLYELHVPAVEYTTAACLLIVGEWLIVGRRLFGCGFEEALEAAALLVVAYSLTERASEPVQTLAFAAALGTAGLRLLNPLLTTLAAVALTAGLRRDVSCEWTSYAIAAGALGASLRCYRRPSHDRMLGWLMVVMPACGCGWLAMRVDDPPAAAALPALFGVLALTLGIRRRMHAPVIAFLVCAGCVAYDLRRFSGLALETRLILGGACVLAVAVGIERWLASGRGGISARPPPNDEAFDLLQLAGAVQLAAQDAPPAGRFKGGGGTFSGGGADGGY